MGSDHARHTDAGVGSWLASRYKGVRVAHDVVDVDAQVDQGHRTRRGGAEAVDTDRGVGPPRPTECGGGLDRQAGHALWEHHRLEPVAPPGEEIPPRCSIGWWVGPSSPRPTESWVKTYSTLACDSAARRMAPRM